MKIAIAGYGVEGQESYHYWSQSPENEITIVNNSPVEVPVNTPTIFGLDAFEKLEDFDLVVRSPSLPPRQITTNGKIWSATNEFFEKCPAPIIGVTGSKGKGTTSSLIASILEAAGRKTWLVGNIGVPALSVLDQVQSEDIVVYELSSFQLWDLEKSPHIAVVLFIEQEHLDVHASMEEYVEAKAQIARHQTSNDLLIYNAQNKYSLQIAETSQAKKIGYPSEEAAHVLDANAFYYGQQKLCSLESLQLEGSHNIDNALAAIDAVWAYTQDATAMETGLKNFKGLPHRLAYVKTVNNVAYYDDSIATTPGSAIAAMRAFSTQPQVIILGGSYKGSDFSDLAVELTHQNVYAILIGEEAKHIASALDFVGFKDYEILENATAESFTQLAAEKAQPGGVVLLSPAAASFGLFKNYADRGEQFIAAVNKL